MPSPANALAAPQPSSLSPSLTAQGNNTMSEQQQLSQHLSQQHISQPDDNLGYPEDQAAEDNSIPEDEEEEDEEEETGHACELGTQSTDGEDTGSDLEDFIAHDLEPASSQESDGTDEGTAQFTDSQQSSNGGDAQFEQYLAEVNPNGAFGEDGEDDGDDDSNDGSQHSSQDDEEDADDDGDESTVGDQHSSQDEEDADDDGDESTVGDQHSSQDEEDADDDGDGEQQQAHHEHGGEDGGEPEDAAGADEQAHHEHGGEDGGEPEDAAGADEQAHHEHGGEDGGEPEDEQAPYEHGGEDGEPGVAPGAGNSQSAHEDVDEIGVDEHEAVGNQAGPSAAAADSQDTDDEGFEITAVTVVIPAPKKRSASAQQQDKAKRVKTEQAAPKTPAVPLVKVQVNARVLCEWIHDDTVTTTLGPWYHGDPAEPKQEGLRRLHARRVMVEGAELIQFKFWNNTWTWAHSVKLRREPLAPICYGCRYEEVSVVVEKPAKNQPNA
ncbi:hypothetical protein OC842_005944 [Tilletia horrida]|uniref:Uncharacterized protein n=1 Tax=Tilletia horrida TaxID=155126 RepID=A0AAN6JIH6_9BASI|nr:hypothetical protein OC842_005944 [Tilletia horrida]